MPTGDCKLTPFTDDFGLKLKASSTGEITLEVTGANGSLVRFKAAEYHGARIPSTPSSKITFTIVAGLTDLDVIYAFSDPANGQGVLKEVCSANTKLDDVTAVEPAVRYVISA